jgi:hypothetical protein
VLLVILKLQYTAEIDVVFLRREGRGKCRHNWSELKELWLPVLAEVMDCRLRGRLRVAYRERKMGFPWVVISVKRARRNDDD